MFDFELQKTKKTMATQLWIMPSRSLTNPLWRSTSLVHHLCIRSGEGLGHRLRALPKMLTASLAVLEAYRYRWLGLPALVMSPKRNSTQSLVSGCLGYTVDAAYHECAAHLELYCISNLSGSGPVAPS